MSTRAETERLAEEIDQYGARLTQHTNNPNDGLMYACAAELRRLAAENAVMRKDAERWQHASNLDALMTYCPTCCEGLTEKTEMSRDETIFECGKTAGWSKSKQELRRMAAIEAAARNLVKVKGRYHTEQAFKALSATLENPHG